ncbi:hypothetical protein TNIN_57651, partial [Trichonephila inaurata madagascariensis]
MRVLAYALGFLAFVAVAI